jgi:hypothetical protein
MSIAIMIPTNGLAVRGRMECLAGLYGLLALAWSRLNGALELHPRRIRHDIPVALNAAKRTGTAAPGSLHDATSSVPA